MKMYASTLTFADDTEIKSYEDGKFAYVDDKGETQYFQPTFYSLDGTPEEILHKAIINVAGILAYVETTEQEKPRESVLFTTRLKELLASAVQKINESN